MSRPHNQRTMDGLFTIDINVTLPDGSGIAFRSNKGARLPADFVERTMQALAIALSMKPAEAERFVADAKRQAAEICDEYKHSLQPAAGGDL